MSISFEQAKSSLAAGGFTVSSLFSLVESVSGKVLGATAASTYLLYSGVMPDGSTQTSTVAASLKNSGGGLVVTMSEVGQVFKSNEFLKAFDEAVKLELFNNIDFVPVTQEQFDAINSRKNFLLNGKSGASALVIPPISTGPKSRTVMQPWPSAALG